MPPLISAIDIFAAFSPPYFAAMPDYFSLIHAAILMLLLPPLIVRRAATSAARIRRVDMLRLITLIIFTRHDARCCRHAESHADAR